MTSLQKNVSDLNYLKDFSLNVDVYHNMGTYYVSSWDEEHVIKNKI